MENENKDSIEFVKEAMEWKQFLSERDYEISDTVAGHIALRVREIIREKFPQDKPNNSPKMPEPKKECKECSNKKDHDWGLCECECHSSSQELKEERVFIKCPECHQQAPVIGGRYNIVHDKECEKCKNAETGLIHTCHPPSQIVGAVRCEKHNQWHQDFCPECKKESSSSQNGLEWEKNFDDMFVYTDFADTHGIEVNRPWRPTFGLPDREIACLKFFVKQIESQSYQKGCKDGEEKQKEHDKEVITALMNPQLDVAKEARKDERSKVLNELREIVETKLRNDPKNPVLNVGLEYTLIVIKGLSEHKEDKGV